MSSIKTAGPRSGWGLYYELDAMIYGHNKRFLSDFHVSRLEDFVNGQFSFIQRNSGKPASPKLKDSERTTTQGPLSPEPADSPLNYCWIGKNRFLLIDTIENAYSLTLLLPPLYWLISVKQCDSDDFKFVSPQWNQNLKKNHGKKRNKKEFCAILLITYTVRDNLSDLCGKASEDIQCRLGRLKVTYFMTGWS